MIDTLDAERFAPLGEQPLCVVALDESGALAYAEELSTTTDAIIVGVDRQGALPPLDPASFDALLTTASTAPAPWVSVAPRQLDQRLDTIAAGVAAAPIAAAICMQVLRMNQSLDFREALKLESLAYSTLLGGDAFRRWRAARPPAQPVHSPGPPLICERNDDSITIRLNAPANRNGMCAAMRDGLFEALAAVLDDPTRPSVSLEGAGPCFSTGGDLSEFGSAQDLALAHAIRTMRSCADLLHRIGDRATAVLHGACIGSGIEVPAAAARRVGRKGVFFQLPELAMGLMPGAGGTVTLPRAIGRHRTAYMVLSGKRIDTATALDWGLIQVLEEL